MFRRLKNINTDHLCVVPSTHYESLKAQVSLVCKLVYASLCDLTRVLGHIIPCTRDILQFSNNKACIQRHLEAGLFLFPLRSSLAFVALREEEDERSKVARFGKSNNHYSQPIPNTYSIN